ncbi:MAG: sulfatase-like hydrolase/transferase [Fimbriimonadaceae bacterium]|nr:sulfatase-like hydrolase/transferase [Fimbriimonadaceae bacterium]
MRILYFDIDSLRPANLGCYGHIRPTSPNIDALAARGAVIQSLYATDTPCLPSRTGFFGGRFGAQSGVVNHGGVCADLPSDGAARWFRSSTAERSLASILSRAGLRTCTISGFPRRHSAYQMVYGFHETIDLGRHGTENADQVAEPALEWIDRRGREENWFLHVNMWDPHTPYDTPADFGDPFADSPALTWLTEEMLQDQRASYGPHSSREVPGWTSDLPGDWVWGRGEIKDLGDARNHWNAYDAGVAYADLHIGRILNRLADLGVLDETVVIVSADHGENLGELNVWGDHQTADEFTNHIPGVVCGPGIAPGRVGGIHAHLDLAATIVDLAGASNDASERGWVGQSLLPALRGEAAAAGRGELLLSHGAWSLQRALRWDDMILIHTRHTGFKEFPEWMLFDLKTDPHETRNLAGERPDIVAEKGEVIREEAARLAADCVLGDPFDVVESEGGPHHANIHDPAWPQYLARLRATGRAGKADQLERLQGRPVPVA